MKFNCGPSAARRAELRWNKDEADWKRIQEWHDHFTWTPIRMGENDCRWLETIERKFVGDLFDFRHFYNYSRCWKYRAKS